MLEMLLNVKVSIHRIFRTDLTVLKVKKKKRTEKQCFFKRYFYQDFLEIDFLVASDREE